MEEINIIEKIKSGDEAYNSYIHSFLARFIYGISSYEKIDFESEENSLILSDTYEAFDYLLEYGEGYITPNKIKNVFEIMCRNIEGFVPGFRKYDVETYQGKIKPSAPWSIQSDLSSTIYQYNNSWGGMDQYTKEAYFHIEYSRIQPFEDFNKRVGRLILAYNMMYNGYAPAIVPLNLQDEYNEAIAKRNYPFLAKIIEDSSNRECEIIKRIIERENSLEEQGKKK